MSTEHDGERQQPESLFQAASRRALARLGFMPGDGRVRLLDVLGVQRWIEQVQQQMEIDA